MTYNQGAPRTTARADFISRKDRLADKNGKHISQHNREQKYPRVSL